MPNHFNQNLLTKTLLWLFLLMPSFISADTRELVEAIKNSFPSASPLIIIILGSIIIIGLGLLVIWEIIKSDRKKQNKAEISWQNFSDFIKEKKLIPNETNLLKEIIYAGRLIEADTVFTVPAIYERSLDTYIYLKQKNNDLSPPTLEGLLDLRKKMGYSRLSKEIHLSSTRQLNHGLQFNYILEGETETKQGYLKDITEEFWLIDSIKGSFSSHQKPGTGIEIRFIRHGDAEYTIKSQLIQVSKEGASFQHTLKLTRKQLRSWVRVEVNIPCQSTIAQMPQGEQKHLSIDTSLEGLIVDISGGGACLKQKQTLPPNTLIYLNFNLPGSPIKQLQSEVIGSNLVKNEDPEQYIIRLKFIDIETALQEKIVRYVFEKNRMDYQFR